ncbi:MAG: hypothetical protein AAGA44_00030 [Pseudomonadota bacterium]
MLLRRISVHVQQQNWFAVGIDFIIVVIGVYLGIQVSNWNDAVRLQSLEDSYVLRLSDELRLNIDDFAEQVRFAEQSRDVLREFLEALEDSTTSDEALILHTRNYFSQGVFLAKFRPSHATFDELKSTGNLDIIEDKELREQLVVLHLYFDDGVDIFDTNNSWVLQSEDVVYLSFDALRYDSRTTDLFSEQTAAESAKQVRANRELLTRHAALHFWLKDRAVEVLTEASKKTESVLRRINSE